MNRVKITITGEQGSGKTMLFNQIVDALTNKDSEEFYEQASKPSSFYGEDEIIINNNFHTVIITTEQLQ